MSRSYFRCIRVRARPFLRVAIRLSPHVRLIDPVGYLDMVSLTRSARLVLTDSGGLQKEAYWLGVPCVTLREETEWVETVDAGWNKLVGSECEKIVQGVRTFVPPSARPALYGDGRVAARCAMPLGVTEIELRREPRKKS